jgi:hypothetical protein
MVYKLLCKVFTVLILLVFPLGTFAENIDPDNDGSQYAWSENIGWINFQPSFGIGVTVSDSSVAGYAWGENVGWINLNPTEGGVINDGVGNLSGYAWGENVGWINFAPSGGGVTIESGTGVFNGYAWGENIGWVNFAPTDGGVKTSWRGVADSDGDGISDNVDTQPTIFSQDFSDVSIDGTTTGTITNRGNQILTITEETNPSGVRIATDSAGGPTAATISACGGASIMSIGAGEEVVVTCSSVTIEVIRGTVDIVFIADDGTSANVSLNAGNSLTCDPTAVTITAHESNADDVVVLINGVEVTIAPDATVNISDTDGDGVLYEEDECPGTLQDVAVASNGCSVYQALENMCPADSNWKNHGKYVSCVAHTAEEYVDMGVITEEEKDVIVSEAAQREIGKKEK